MLYDDLISIKLQKVQLFNTLWLDVTCILTEVFTLLVGLYVVVSACPGPQRDAPISGWGSFIS